MKNILILIFILLTGTMFSQTTIEDIVNEVEKNNLVLKSLQKGIEAEKLGNKTGLLPSNPEIGFNYLFGNPDIIGERKDLSIMQSIDFPTVYIHKSKVSKLKNEQLDFLYLKSKKEITLEITNTCIEIVYLNILIKDYTKRLTHAEKTADLYKKMFENGKVNIIEHNKAQLYYLSIKNELDEIEINRKFWLQELANFNAGKEINVSLDVFDDVIISQDFDKWYSENENSNPIINFLKKEKEIDSQDLKLSRAKSLPEISAGYMSETVAGESFAGVSVGLSIPLWGNRNTVKYSKAKLIATEQLTESSKLTIYNNLKQLHSKLIDMQKQYLDYKSKSEQFSNIDYLDKALSSKEISIIEYFTEISNYYENITKLFQMKKELNLTLAKFEQYL